MRVSHFPVLCKTEQLLLPSDACARIETALSAVNRWLERNQYLAYEPFDGLESVLRPLTFGTKLGRQLLVQTVKRSPINLRPWIGIRPATSSKGMGFLTRGYIRLHQIRPQADFCAKAQQCLRWLRSHSSAGYSGLCWGNHFDYQTRTYYLSKGQPTVVWSALIGHAFLDSFELWEDEADLNDALSICRFILNDLPRLSEANGQCISYVTHAGVWVHNANALAAGLLARAFKHNRDCELYDAATAALEYTVYYQHNDGSWFYAEQPNLHWTDNWHTAYVLDSLLEYYVGTGDDRFAHACKRGWKFYYENFFLPDGCPKYYSHSAYPIDIQCASQSIETLCRFSQDDDRSLSMAVRVALWAIDNMQDKDGYFYFQRHRHFVNRTPCFHWGQATMVSALALLLQQLENANSR